MILYFFDNLKQVLFRRGKKTLKVFTMSTPMLRIKLSDKLIQKISDYNQRDKAHQCANFQILKLQYKVEDGTQTGKY